MIRPTKILEHNISVVQGFHPSYFLSNSGREDWEDLLKTRLMEQYNNPLACSRARMLAVCKGLDTHMQMFEELGERLPSSSSELSDIIDSLKAIYKKDKEIVKNANELYLVKSTFV